MNEKVSKMIITSTLQDWNTSRLDHVACEPNLQPQPSSLFIFHCMLVIEACEEIVLSIEKVFDARLLRDACDWALYATTR